MIYFFNYFVSIIKEKTIDQPSKENFYVYAYLREDRTPYYIGKGKKDRAFSNNGRFIKLPKDRSLICFLGDNLNEESALCLEARFIKIFGRIDNGTGILHNLTDGGDGGHSGAIRKPWPEERKLAQSTIRKGKNYEELFGTKKAKEWKYRISEKMKVRIPTQKQIDSLGFYGFQHTEESKLKISHTRIERASGAGINNANYISTIYKLYNTKTGKNVSNVQSELRKMNLMSSGRLCMLLNDKILSCNSWIKVD